MIFGDNRRALSDHPFRRLHALSRVAVVSALCLLTYILEGWLPLALIFLLVAFTRALPGEGAGEGLGELFSILRTLLPFVVLIVLVNVLLVARERPIAYRALFGLKQSFRVLIVIVALRVLLWTTSPVELSDAFIRALHPLGRFGVRVEEFSLVLMLVFSFVPLITREADRIRTAQAVRIGFKRGIGRFREVVPLLVPLVIGVFKRAEEVERSLNVRYFDRRSYSRRESAVGLSSLDVAAMVLSAAGIAAGMYWGG